MSPDQKGIETISTSSKNTAPLFTMSPDQKGIETVAHAGTTITYLFTMSPDQKGIETRMRKNVGAANCSQ